MTWGQSILILYLVYWRQQQKYSQDASDVGATISLDAILKYFCSGFVISITMSFIYELFLQVFGLAVLILIEFESLEDMDSTTLQTQAGIHDFLRHHLVDGAVASFFMAFVVAALVEEIWKYFGFYMLQTPDLMDQNKIILENNNNISTSNLNHVIQGSNITIAMVTVAIGFACAENLEYVFGTKSVKTELFTLMIRAILPVHPLCAAIQSVGVVKRDIEGRNVNTSRFGTGRILFPAILLHGMFDFIAMFVGFVETVESDDIFIDDDQVAAEQRAQGGEKELTTQEIILNLKSIVFVLPVVVVGVVYYFIASRSQRRRLQELGMNLTNNRELLLVEIVGDGVSNNNTGGTEEDTQNTTRTSSQNQPSNLVDAGEFI
eukprot:CAMPEP_0202442016 /NCGR_PEP_ID=MMETSP1360-20130828/1516_1 /ASSEMBLY_ACC=CAM_ASM_000848 /TAXON_ID=515479 /ORGANISM="Licmophora paradoxa, Strain CCMP2313" /LENGTH=376 /DNA_ID=CAMNT_0049057253 /DNA_START=716 /DNA_END=1846 /DNA_ORIENTATION=-